MPMRLLAAAFAACLMAAPAAGADTFQSPATRVSLLELYTSEGCNSCPPADRWLSRLEHDPRLWRQVIPVAFHVDYWDYIGWPDRFASRGYSDRQRRYAEKGRLQSVYTPGFVLAGGEWRGWFYKPVLNLETGEDVGKLRLALDGGGVRAVFEPSGPEHTALELHVAVLGFDLETEVAAGENAGRTLTHDFVVLGHGRVDMQRDGGVFTADTVLPEPRFESARKAVAAWVSVPGDPNPLQAVGGWMD